MTDLHDNDEPRDLRPHERDPDAEPPHVDECDVTLALAALAGEVWGVDGSTAATEFFFNTLSVEQQNALTLSMYVNNETFRALFNAEHGASVRNRLRDAA